MLLLNILNQIIENKKTKRQGFLSDLKRFLNQDHSQRRFISSNHEQDNHIKVKGYPNFVVKQFADHTLKKQDEMITLIKNLPFHNVLQQAYFLNRNKRSNGK